MKTNYFTDFLALIFPRVCPVCGTNLFSGELILCTKCLYDLPRTDITDFYNNPVASLFWGRAKIEMATSFFYFVKGSRYQQILHQLKYKGRKNIGVEMGKLFGAELYRTSFSQIDLIHPVPLYYKKLKKRGYNQSDLIAEGISEKLKKPVITNVIERRISTDTQTNKSRFERWANVEGIFTVNNPSVLANKHVLLVDDVVTTGSTLEACANAILSVDGTKVSIITLGVAKMN